MTTQEARELVSNYVTWLREKITVEQVGDVFEITTPFLDRHNDQMQLYIRKANGALVLSDDGYTLRDLQLSGFELNSPKRRQLTQTILNGFGVQLKGDELLVDAKAGNFPQKKHNLVQAMLAVNDLYVTAEPTVLSLFREDVERFLRTHEVRFTPAVKFTGRSGFDHFFDFVIPESKQRPERVLRAINHPNRTAITSLIFAWDDTRGIRAPNSTAYAFMNDTDKEINVDLTEALKQYDITPIEWSKRERHVQELVI